MKSNLKQNWQPRWLTRMPKGWRHTKPKYFPSMTNHQRMFVRQAYRDAKRSQQEAQVTQWP